MERAPSRPPPTTAPRAHHVRLGTCTLTTRTTTTTVHRTYDPTKLYHHDQVPAVLRFNRYIRSGYRAGLTYPQCCRSMFHYHNETVNIWTHFIPCIILAALAMRATTTALLLNLTSLSLCLAGSAAYHTCMARHQHYRAWLMVDVCGIFVIFLVNAPFQIVWGMPCRPDITVPFTAAYYVVGALAIVGSLRGRTPITRGLPMLVLFLMRVGFLVARLLLGRGSTAGAVHCVVSEGWMALGGVINATRVPERWLVDVRARVGVCDYWLNSHQIMHVLALVAMWHLHQSVTVEQTAYAAAC